MVVLLSLMVSSWIGVAMCDCYMRWVFFALQDGHLLHLSVSKRESDTH